MAAADPGLHSLGIVIESLGNRYLQVNIRLFKLINVSRLCLNSVVAEIFKLSDGSLYI